MLKRWQLPAKLNWTLEVLGKRADGFHELRSWFVAIDAGDRLSAEIGEGSGLRLTGPHTAGVPEGPSNLALRAERAWREAGGRAPAVRWTLEKRLPAGTGLGAGSADAAGVLLALQEFADEPLAAETLEAVAASLGSDLSFFLGAHGAELRGGGGEELLAHDSAPFGAVALAWPSFAVATPAVFAALGAPAVDPSAAPAPVPVLPPLPGRNDLVAAARASHPALAAFAGALAALGRFTMSGSGGAHFAVCADLAEAQRLATSVHAAGHAALAASFLPGPAPQEIAA